MYFRCHLQTLLCTFALGLLMGLASLLQIITVLCYFQHLQFVEGVRTIKIFCMLYFGVHLLSININDRSINVRRSRFLAWAVVCYTLMQKSATYKSLKYSTSKEIKKIKKKPYLPPSESLVTLKVIVHSNNWKTPQRFFTKMPHKYTTPLTWLESLLFPISQTQQAAVQTVISQIPVRNLPSGSYLFPVMDCSSYDATVMICQNQEV